MREVPEQVIVAIIGGQPDTKGRLTPRFPR
jgi:hypothetical protein